MLSSSRISCKQYSQTSKKELKPLNFADNFKKGMNWIDLKSKNSLDFQNEPRLRSSILYSHEKISSQVLYSDNNICSLNTSNDKNFEMKMPIRRAKKIERSFRILSKKITKKIKLKKIRRVTDKKGFYFVFYEN